MNEFSQHGLRHAEPRVGPEGVPVGIPHGIVVTPGNVEVDKVCVVVRREEANQRHIRESTKVLGDRTGLSQCSTLAVFRSVRREDGRGQLGVDPPWVRDEPAVGGHPVLAKLDLVEALRVVVNTDLETHGGGDDRDLTLTVRNVASRAEDKRVVAVAEEPKGLDAATELRAVVVHNSTVATAGVEVTGLSVLPKCVDVVTGGIGVGI